MVCTPQVARLYGPRLPALICVMVLVVIACAARLPSDQRPPGLLRTLVLAAPSVLAVIGLACAVHVVAPWAASCLQSGHLAAARLVSVATQSLCPSPTCLHAMPLVPASCGPPCLRACMHRPPTQSLSHALCATEAYSAMGSSVADTLPPSLGTVANRYRP